MNLSTEALELFNKIAKDACNWSGVPLLDIGSDAKNKGYVTKMKRAKLLTTEYDEGCTWVYFTKSGVELAEQNGISLSDYYGA